MRAASLGRRALTEFLATLFLLMAVVGSGVMAERLCGNTGLALLANAIATGAALIAIILAFGHVSGAHMNPVVTLADAWLGGIAWQEAPAYITAQVLGAVGGVFFAHAMFGLPVIEVSTHVRAGDGQWLAEFVATFGLMAVIWGSKRAQHSATPFAVGAYVTAAYWFTASTSFANPAVTLARCLTNTFSGIRPGDVAPFVLMQLCGAAVGTVMMKFLLAEEKPVAG